MEYTDIIKIKRKRALFKTLNSLEEAKKIALNSNDSMYGNNKGIIEAYDFMIKRVKNSFKFL